jgi:hypothetical protein
MEAEAGDAVGATSPAGASSGEEIVCEEGGLGGLGPGGQGFLDDVLDGTVFHYELY